MKGKVLMKACFPKLPASVPLGVVLTNLGKEYVCLVYDTSTDSCFWGHYFPKEELEAAKSDFLERVARYADDSIRMEAAGRVEKYVDEPETLLQRLAEV